MANNGVFKTLGPNDTGNSKASLHEQIPITGSIIGNHLTDTYGTFPSESNVKYFTTGDHIDVYDYPYASSSANFMFSMTAGYSSNVTAHIANNEATTKNNIYRQFAQQYVGYDTNQDFVDFNVSGVLNPPNTFPPKFDGAIFIDFSRVLMKDEIKKGSFTITIGTGSFHQVFSGTKTFSDAHVVEGNQATYKSNSPMGEYALLQDAKTLQSQLYAIAGKASPQLVEVAVTYDDLPPYSKARMYSAARKLPLMDKISAGARILSRKLFPR